MQGVAVGRRVVVGDRRARLHRADDDAVVDELEPRDVRGLGEGLGDLGGVAVMVSRAPTLPGALVVELRRAGLRRPRAASVTAGSASMSSATASAASLACAAVSATTKATGSPTKRTLSLASDGRGGVFIGEPSRFLSSSTALAAGRSPPPRGRRRCRRRARPASPRAASMSMPLMTPCAIRAAHHHGVGLARQVHVVGVAALAAQQGRVFLARHRLADAEFIRERSEGRLWSFMNALGQGGFEPCSRPGPPEASKRRSRRGSPELRA